MLEDDAEDDADDDDDEKCLKRSESEKGNIICWCDESPFFV